MCVYTVRFKTRTELVGPCNQKDISNRTEKLFKNPNWEGGLPVGYLQSVAKI